MSERLDNRMERLIDESYDFQAGYDAAIKDVVAWLDEKSDGCCYAGEYYSEAIERGEAKGAANE
jgi:hypothetical protein